MLAEGNDAMLKQAIGALVIGAALVGVGASGSHSLMLGSSDNWKRARGPGMVVTVSAASICRRAYGAVRHGRTRYGPAFYHVLNQSCWSCPTGYRRTANPNVKGRKACRQPATKRYARAQYRGRATGFPVRGKCPRGSGQFLHIKSGSCYVCPRGYRKTLAGINSPRKCVRTTPARYSPALYRGRPPTSQCGGLNQRPCPIAMRGRTCERGLSRNWLANRCTPSGPAELRRKSKRALNELRTLLRGARALQYCRSIRGKMDQLRTLLKTRNVRQLADWPRRDPCLKRLRAVARSGGYRTFTIGIGGDIQLGAGINAEIGVAFDVDLRRPPRIFSTLGWSAGWGASVGNDLVMSFYKAPNSGIAGRAQGFVYAGKALGGGGAAIWYDMSGRLAGASAFVSAGVGGEVGVYNRIRTTLK